MHRTKTALSLFSGAGGCGLGLKESGFDVRLAVDIDRDACATYSDNLGHQTVWQQDLTHVAPETVSARANLRPHEIDLIVGGPPCQGFSSAGSRGWNDPRNALVRKYVEMVAALRPTWFVMENVEGFLTATQGAFFIEAIVRLLEAGYWVSAKKVYMERYGLPQRRKRVVVVGNLEQCHFAFPTPTHFEPVAFPWVEQPNQLSVLDAIGDLAVPTEYAETSYQRPAVNDYQRQLRRLDGKGLSWHRLKRISALNEARVRLLGEGETMRDLPEHLQHPSYARRAFRRVMDGTPTEKRGGAPSGLKRLAAAKPSLTITSASPSELIHPMQDRVLTLRECARLQSFPDSYEFIGTWSSVATQIGNAIPPLFMSLLSRHIADLATWRRCARGPGRWLGIEATRSNGMSPALVSMLSDLEERTSTYAR